ncbi:MAG TPA: hypothetical protein VG796_20255 [Verrucomicrobiales bacterium]|nr:hypothetical protein [Verrucomicrobiales bacterium]
MLGLLISAGLLCLSMYLVARNEAEINFAIVLLICLGVTVLNFLIARPLGYFSIPVIFAALAWALHQFCTLRWSKAILVTAVYVVVSTAFALLLR